MSMIERHVSQSGIKFNLRKQGENKKKKEQQMHDDGHSVLFFFHSIFYQEQG